MAWATYFMTGAHSLSKVWLVIRMSLSASVLTA